MTLPALTIQHRLPAAQSAQAYLTLSFEARSKSRLLTQLDDGTPVGLFLPRGTLLRGGDCLQASDGRIIEVRAATEALSVVLCQQPLLFTRAAYHLGNRHVALQIEAGRLAYQQDYVLDQMLEQLGLHVLHEQAPFEPEAGAYGGGHAHA